MAFLGIAWSFLTSKTGMYLMAALAVGIFLWRVHHDIYESGYADGSKKVQAQFDSYKDAATKRSTDLALLWAASLDKIASESAKRQEAESERNRAFDERAAALSHLPTIVIGADAAKLWGDITPSGPVPAKPSTPASREQGAKTFSESALVGFVSAAKAAYDDAVGLFHDARNALNACIAANLHSEGS